MTEVKSSVSTSNDSAPHADLSGSVISAAQLDAQASRTLGFADARAFEIFEAGIGNDTQEDVKLPPEAPGPVQPDQSAAPSTSALAAAAALTGNPAAATAASVAQTAVNAATSPDLTAVKSYTSLQNSTNAKIDTEIYNGASNDGKFSIWQAGTQFVSNMFSSVKAALWPLENLAVTAVTTAAIIGVGWMFPPAIPFMVMGFKGLAAAYIGSKTIQAGILVKDAYVTGNGDLAEQAAGKLGEAAPAAISVAGRFGWLGKMAGWLGETTIGKNVAGTKVGAAIVSATAKVAPFVYKTAPGVNINIGARDTYEDFEEMSQNAKARATLAQE